MTHPDIRSYHDSRRSHYIASLSDRKEFLGHNPQDMHNRKPNSESTVTKNGDLYTLEVLLPGFHKDEFIITIVDNILTVRGESKIEERRSSEYLLREYRTDSIERKYVLGNAIGHEDVKAKYEDEVLKIIFTDVPSDQEVDHKIVTID